MPQIGALYGALLAVPDWLRAADMEVVVWDFRAIGGPLYCGYAWSTMCYGDCVREAARRAVGDWHAFAFGHSYPFLMVLNSWRWQAVSFSFGHQGRLRCGMEPSSLALTP